MEPLPDPGDPPSNEMLRDFASFVEGGRNSGASFSCVVDVKCDESVLQFSVELQRTGGSNPNYTQKRSHTFSSQSVALQAVRTLVACPSWTRARFVFRHAVPGLRDLILAMFALLRSSRSLSALELVLVPSYQSHLPFLLWESPSLETLTVSPGIKPHSKDLEPVALYLSRSSVLKSCTLAVNSINLDCGQWEMMLSPFMSSSVAASVAELKELVLQIQAPTPCEEAIAMLLQLNTTLEKLEVRSFCPTFDTSLDSAPSLRLPLALRVNHTLREFGCVWSVVDLKELVDVFIPGISGHPANTSLTTLKLFPTLDCRIEDYVKELRRMLKFNTTLKHVEVVPVGWIRSWIIGEDRYWKGPQDLVLRLRRELEMMMRNELRLNTCLESLVLGYWRLVRVGGEWQMSYGHGGPCLSRELLKEEYDVKVKLR